MQVEEREQREKGNASESQLFLRRTRVRYSYASTTVRVAENRDVLLMHWYSYGTALPDGEPCPAVPCQCQSLCQCPAELMGPCLARGPWPCWGAAIWPRHQASQGRADQAGPSVSQQEVPAYRTPAAAGPRLTSQAITPSVGVAAVSSALYTIRRIIVNAGYRVCALCAEAHSIIRQDLPCLGDP